MSSVDHSDPTRPSPGMSPYFSSEEAAQYLRTTRRAVYQLVYRGLLTPCPGTRKLLFTRGELDQYLTTPRLDREKGKHQTTGSSVTHGPKSERRRRPYRGDKGRRIEFA